MARIMFSGNDVARKNTCGMTTLDREVCAVIHQGNKNTKSADAIWKEIGENKYQKSSIIKSIGKLYNKHNVVQRKGNGPYYYYWK